ncbi:kinase-associated lipoprotein B [Paenibacillus turpanensis]|uniref:kinase-associated lipoprotein B n=1 Tax=Paenibacillus turpanensis TaxID=2689078 RepID=UPI001FB5B819|nr:kinase-associated lipoprotein B [Paenibacillus turpanensis]
MDQEQKQLVIAEYKTGVYIGELLSSEGPKAKVRVLAVRKHPEQGDLHQPMEADVAMFHQRRALAYREVANVPAASVRPYQGGMVPAYEESLRASLAAEIERLQGVSRWAERSLQELSLLRTDYGFDKS